MSDLELHQAFGACFRTEAGRRVLEELVVRCGLLVPHPSPDDTNPHDPYQMAYREGQRSVMLFILAQMAPRGEDPKPFDADEFVRERYPQYQR